VNKATLALATALAGASLAYGSVGMAGAATIDADPSSASYQQGSADRDSWETWFNNLKGFELEGANYWAGQRSLNAPVPCSTHASNGDDWLTGCTEAKGRLAASDARRKIDPQYQNGWNKVGATPLAVQQQRAPPPLAPTNTTPLPPAGTLVSRDIPQLQRKFDANSEAFINEYGKALFSDLGEFQEFT